MHGGLLSTGHNSTAHIMRGPAMTGHMGGLNLLHREHGAVGRVFPHIHMLRDGPGGPSGLSALHMDTVPMLYPLLAPELPILLVSSPVHLVVSMKEWWVLSLSC